MLLAAQCQLGTQTCNYRMERYVYKRRSDDFYIINLEKTWEKLRLAARAIVAVENPEDIVVLSSRPYAQRAALKFSSYTSTKTLTQRHVSGLFTNHTQKRFEEPRLLIVTDPKTEHQPVKETSYVNIPVIAFCDTESSLKNVDIAIPANNKDDHSIGMLYYILARMVQQMRGTLEAGQPWNVMVDSFFFCAPDETEKQDLEDFEDADPLVSHGQSL